MAHIIGPGASHEEGLTKVSLLPPLLVECHYNAARTSLHMISRDTQQQRRRTILITLHVSMNLWHTVVTTLSWNNHVVHVHPPPPGPFNWSSSSNYVLIITHYWSSTLFCHLVTFPKPPVPSLSFSSQDPQLWGCCKGTRFMVPTRPQQCPIEGVWRQRMLTGPCVHGDGSVCPHLEEVCPHLEEVCPQLEEVCPHLEEVCPHL